jgi:hypothetical protein
MSRWKNGNEFKDNEQIIKKIKYQASSQKTYSKLDGAEMSDLSIFDFSLDLLFPKLPKMDDDFESEEEEESFVFLEDFFSLMLLPTCNSGIDDAGDELEEFDCC